MGPTRLFQRVTRGLAALLFLCSPLLADSVSYNLNTPNGELSSSQAPYGNVGLKLNANGTISILVTMASNFSIGRTHGIAGGGPAFGLNGPAGLTFSAFTFDFSCCEPSARGYGGFQYVIKSPPRRGHELTFLSFIVTAPGRFTTVNQLGNNFMVHVIPRNGTQTGSATVAVPDGDPSTLMLFLLGLGVSGTAAMVLKSRAVTENTALPLDLP